MYQPGPALGPVLTSPRLNVVVPDLETGCGAAMGGGVGVPLRLHLMMIFFNLGCPPLVWVPSDTVTRLSEGLAPSGRRALVIHPVWVGDAEANDRMGD